jgi:hypothetical protein
MRQYIGLLLVIFIASLTSCRNDFDFETSTGGLEFSKDTVYLDTVFTNIGSSTYTLKVYNRSDKNISIPSIRLNKGQNSKYRLMVDGMPGKEFSNIEMLAKDSMFVFIEVTEDVANVNPSDFLYTDFIEFGTGANFQKVELVTLIQDAYFIYPSRTPNGNGGFNYEEINLGDNENPIPIRASILNANDPINGNEFIWNASKPYVIYGYAVVPPTETLTVVAGARIHFHADSGIIVANDASLVVNGEPSETDALENEVIFEGDRLEPDFSEVPGQWGTIWLTNGSHSNILNNLTIKNAVIGLYVNGNDGTNSVNATLNNVQIYNCSNIGLYATTGFVDGKNVVINNCGQASFQGSFGGSYEFTHCTFANYWPAPNQTCVALSNDSINNISTPLIKANFNNCIIYGSSNLGISHKNEGGTFNFKYTNCLIKFIDNTNQFVNVDEYDFTNSSIFVNCIIASNSTQNKPDFKNPSKNQLIIGSESAAKGSANTSFSTFKDILDKDRPELGLSTTDIGAYNFIIFD